MSARQYGIIDGLEIAIAIIQGESYPESHGLVSVKSIVQDLQDEIDAREADLDE